MCTKKRSNELQAMAKISSNTAGWCLAMAFSETTIKGTLLFYDSTVTVISEVPRLKAQDSSKHWELMPDI